MLVLSLSAGFGVIAQKNTSYSGYSNLEFVENKGQWDTSQVKFRAKLSTGDFYLQNNGFTVLMKDTADLKRFLAAAHGEMATPVSVGAGAPAKSSGTTTRIGPVTVHYHVYKVSFSGANENVSIIPEKALDSYNNYFLGNDSTKWASKCKIYLGIVYKNIYDGIDLRYYSYQGTLKYDLIVHPGADPSRIVMKYEGPEKLSIKKGQLLIQTSVGTVKEWIPQSYQVSGSAKLNEPERTPVQCDYVISGGNQVSFRIKNYSPGSTLVIDPSEIFCSFTGSASDNWGYTATYDAAGNAYAGGIVLDESAGGGLNGNGFKVTPGAFQTTYQGGDGSEGTGWNYDVGIMKFTPNGSSRIYATYLGGPGDEQPHSMIVDNSGNLIVAGRTSSGSKFPMKNGGIYGSGGGFDIFITKFNGNGTGLIGSRVIGGSLSDGVNISPKYVTAGTSSLRLNYGDDGRSEVIVDGSDNIYLASCTQSTRTSALEENGGSATETLFPTTAGVFQPLPKGTKGDQDGVLLKTSGDLSTILFSTLLGGTADDAAFVLSINPNNNNIYIGGGTASGDFPGTASGPVISSVDSGGIDGFVSIVSNDGKTLIKSTYYGTRGTDMIYGVKFDKLGFPYVTGTSTGIIPPVNSPFNQNNNQSKGMQFITKLKPDLSGVVYSANFGPAGVNYPNISPTAFLVDRCENVYVAGWGGGVDISDGYSNSSTTGLTTTAGALKASTDGEDFYFFVLKRDAASQLYGSFFGQNYGRFGDHVDGGTSRYDQQGIIYEAICANCYGGAVFPTTPGVYAPNNGTGTFACNEAVVKINFNFAGVSAGMKVSINGRDNDTSNCIPLNAVFQDTVRNAKSYIWDFGDGSAPVATTSYQEAHQYTNTGLYTVQLIAIDSSSCNVSDTVYIHVKAGNNPASLDFKYVKGDCLSNDYTFINTSTYTGVPFSGNSFLWDFGDGTQVSSGIGNVTHSYVSAGTYNVELILNDTNYCNSPDTLARKLTVTPYVRARFTTPSTGCAPYTAQFTNISVGGQQFFWDFGDGNTSTSSGSPTNVYTNPGTYTIKLTVIDSSTCNIISDTSITIVVSGAPTAAFSFSPQPPVVNTPTTFFNESVGGVRYEWSFGDGASTVKLTMDTVIHQYEKTDTFQACLIVINQAGCQDTVCHPVAALVSPLLDVPNAFTPGRFGQNGIVKVVGFGISQLIFRIYNRWGQLVFESNDPAIGWDGTFKGVLQPMDVYAYTVEATYFDGSHATKKGDITLLR